MHEWAPQLAQKRVSWVASTFCLGFLILAIVLADSPPATALPLFKANVYAIPAFARKYGMPCSSCHEAWPKLPLRPVVQGQRLPDGERSRRPHIPTASVLASDIPH